MDKLASLDSECTSSLLHWSPHLEIIFNGFRYSNEAIVINMNYVLGKLLLFEYAGAIAFETRRSSVALSNES